MQFAQGHIISFLRSWNSNPDVHVLQKTIHPLPLKMSVLLFTMWVWRSNGIPNSPTSSLARGPFPPQEEPLGSCSSAPLGAWGGACLGGSPRTRKQQSARYLWVFYSKRDSQEVAGLTHTRTFPPNSWIWSGFLPKGQVSGVGRVWEVWRERRNYFPNTSKRTKVSV